MKTLALPDTEEHPNACILSPQRAMPLSVGHSIPKFELRDHDGKSVASDDLLGHGPFVIYFYPKDDTPGCTVEACTFRDQFEAFTDAGARVYGVSADSPESHAKFREKHRLPFTLLSDPGSKVAAAFGVGKTLGILPGRVTFVVDETGKVQHAFSSQLAPKKHVSKALDVLGSLG